MTRAGLPGVAGVVIGGAVLCGAGPAGAQDRGALPAPAPLMPSVGFAQLGRASSTTAASAGLGWDWGWQRRWGERGLFAGFHELSIGHWRADASGGGRAVVTQLGLAPVLRYWASADRSAWFCEAGLGANLVLPIYRTREKQFSTAFNFSEHVGVGYRSADRAWEWSLRLQHFSNAGIGHPNPGEDFVQLRWTTVFDGRPASR